MAKKLIVCGGSVASPSNAWPDSAFGEVLAAKLGWDVEIFARAGCGNGGVRIQIDEAIRRKPDFVIVAPAYHDRIEFPTSASTFTYDAAKNKSEALQLEDHLAFSNLGIYDKNVGLDNVMYTNHRYVSNKTPPRLISDSIPTLLMTGSTKIGSDVKTALKHYVNFLYDSAWKKQQDQWIIRDGILQLYYHNIPFLMVTEALWDFNEVRLEFPLFIPDYCLPKEKETPLYATRKWPCGKFDPGYHGAKESQIYLADIYCNIIKDAWGL
jgi:hypothetical protein